MVFKVKNKVALVTGGASGIGLSHVKELLRNGVKGVVIADINTKNGHKVSAELQNEFGKENVLFVETDVADSSSFENAFEVTLKNFNNVDILINNAGVFLDDNWKREVDINLNGTINGIMLGIEKYLRYHKQEDEAVILNTASISLVELGTLKMFPVYVGTKFAVYGLTKCWGDPFHFERTKVRVVAICPGKTETPILKEYMNHTISSEYDPLSTSALSGVVLSGQSPDVVAKEALKILEESPSGSVWVIENSQPAYEHTMPKRNDVRYKRLQ